MAEIKKLNLTKVKEFLVKDKQTVFAYLFGSFAQEKASPFSDMTLLSSWKKS